MRKSKKTGANAYTGEIKKPTMKASPGKATSGGGVGKGQPKIPNTKGQK